jgi:hypothetical protein
MSQKLDAAVAVIGIDIGKNSFHVVGLDHRGAIVLRQKWSRRQVETRLANIPPCLIGMEAYVGAHHLSRKLTSLGHDARLMPAKYVRPYSRGQKNDFRDAEAIAEAVQHPTMKSVATKTAEQLDLQALHPVRDRLVSQRTGIINQIRAFLLERAIPSPCHSTGLHCAVVRRQCHSVSRRDLFSCCSGFRFSTLRSRSRCSTDRKSVKIPAQLRIPNAAAQTWHCVVSEEVGDNQPQPIPLGD